MTGSRDHNGLLREPNLSGSGQEGTLPPVQACLCSLCFLTVFFFFFQPFSFLLQSLVGLFLFLPPYLVSCLPSVPRCCTSLLLHGVHAHPPDPLLGVCSVPSRLWTVAPLSTGFSKQGYWSGLPLGNLPDLRDRTCVSWVSCIGNRILYH